MVCGNCARENRPDSRFCAGCGSALSKRCGACHRELQPDAAFCDACGSPVGAGPAPNTPTAPAEPVAVRKTVTALFCDLVGSTAFGEKVDPEANRESMNRYFAMARTAIEDNGGTVAKFIGDGVMAMWGVPEVAEDDAERAVRAGLALQDAFSGIRDFIQDRHGVSVGLRVGINTGEVVIADADDDVVGDALNTAARLEAACTPGRVLVGEPTWRLSRHTVEYAEHGVIQAKGKDEPVAAYEVVGLLAVEDPHTETPFVGRDAELRRLQVVMDEAILERAARLVTVIGAPGVGKTRLAREMREAVEGGTRAFELRCEREGMATFAPVADLLRAAAGITDSHSVDEMQARLMDLVEPLDDADRIAGLLAGFVGAAPMQSTEELFLAVRRLFEVLGATQPVVLVVDDIQWAEPLFLDLLEHLAEWVRDVPLMVVCLARPEIRDVRPPITEVGRRVSAVVALEGLDTAATHELAARLVGAEALPADLLAKIPDSTQGNPLFVRELMRMLVDDGVIAERDGRWEMVIDVDAVEVPPTVNTLLASRVERLATDERQALEFASVVGSDFPLGAVAAAAGSASSLDATFERLRRKELIEPTGTYWGDEPVFRFHHVLIRDAAYRRLLKGNRAELHVTIGEWTEQSAASLVGEHEVTIAHHFEQAHQLRLQLGIDDDETVGLGARAAALLRTAAERALEREDLAAAGPLAARALVCVSDDADGLAELLLTACEALLGTGNVAEGTAAVDRLDTLAGDDRRLRAWVDCFRAEITIYTDPGGLQSVIESAGEAAEVLARLDDQAGVAKARLQRAAALVRLGRVGDCEAELDAALTAARAADDRRRVTAVLGSAPIAALWGPSPVPRAGGRCLDVVRLLRITTGSPAVEATSIRCQAVLESLRGRHDTARSMLDNARSTLEEVGHDHGLMETSYFAGLVELLADDPVAAEPHLRRAHQGLGRLGIGADAGQAAAYLARSLLLQDRLDEAEDYALQSDALAGQNPQTAIVSRSVQAEILAARGEFDEALTLAAEAVHLAAGTDILVDHANAVAAQARVRAAAGDTAGAAEAAAAAAALYEEKGATVEVGAAQDHITAPSPADVGRHEDGSTAPGDHPGWAVELVADFVAAMETGDIAAISALAASDRAFRDERSVVGIGDQNGRGITESYFEVEGPIEASSELLAVRGNRLLAASCTMVSDGLAYEWIHLMRRDANGLVDLFVMLDADKIDEALAELDRLHLAKTADNTPDNLAARAQRESIATFAAADRERWAAGFAEDVHLEDQRPTVGLTADGRAGVLAAFEAVLDSASATPWRSGCQVLATRGDHLALTHCELEIVRSGIAYPYLAVTEVSPDGLIRQLRTFDVDAPDEATAELDRLAAELARPDWMVTFDRMKAAHEHMTAGRVDDWAAMLSDDFVWVEHRRGVRLEAVGRDEARDTLQTILHEPDPDADEPPAPRRADEEPPDLEITPVDGRGRNLALARVLTYGGGTSRFEREYLLLGRIRDEDDLGNLAMAFDVDDVENATAELDRLWAEDRDVMGSYTEAWRSRDEHSLHGLYAPDVEFDDRRRLIGGVTASADGFVENQLDHHSSIEQRYELIAERGDRFRCVLVTTDLDDYQRHYIGVSTRNDAGQVERIVAFDEEDLDDALAELERLYEESLSPADRLRFRWLIAQLVEETNAGAPMGTVVTSTFMGLLQEEYVIDDRRLLGRGLQSRHGVDNRMAVDDALVSHGRQIVEQVLHLDGCGLIVRMHQELTLHDGTTVESDAIRAHPLTPDGQFIERVQYHDIADAPAAIEAFRELTASHPYRPDNMAAAASSVVNAAVRVGSSDLPDLLAESVDLDTKRHAFGVTERRPVAVRGENLALIEATTASGERVWSVEEYDDDGRLLDWRLFEADRLLDAADHLDERWLALTPNMSEWERVGLDYARCHRHLDVDGFRRILADDFMASDHRSFGFPTVDLEHFLAVPSQVEARGVLITNDLGHRHGPAGLTHNVIYDAEAGEPIQRMAGITVFQYRDGRIASAEVFAEDDLAGAMARYQELASGRVLTIAERMESRINETATTSVDEAVDLITALAAPGAAISNRRRGLAHESDTDEAFALIEGSRTALAWESELLASRGARLVATSSRLVYPNDFTVDRCAVIRTDVQGRWELQVAVDTPEEALAVLDELETEERLSPDVRNTASMVLERDLADGQDIDVYAIRGDEHALAEIWTTNDDARLHLVTVDIGGNVTDRTTFPVDDLASAIEALERRYVGGLGDAAPEGIETFARTSVAYNLMDPQTFPDLFAVDMTTEFHTTLAAGGGTALLATSESFDNAEFQSTYNADVDTIVAKVNAIADRCALITAHSSERRAPGERWVTASATVVTERHGQLTHMGAWDIDDAASARARFDALAAAGISLAERARDEALGHIAAGSAERYMALLADDVVTEDRRAGSQTTPNRDSTEANVRWVIDQQIRPNPTTIDADARTVASQIRFWSPLSETELVTYMVARYDLDGVLTRAIWVDTETAALAALDEIRAEELRSLELRNTATMAYEAAGHPIARVEAVELDLVAVIDTGSTPQFAVARANRSGGLAVEHFESAADAHDHARAVDPAAAIGFDPATIRAYGAAAFHKDVEALERLLAPQFTLDASRLPSYFSVFTRDELIAFIASGRGLGVDETARKTLGIADGALVALFASAGEETQVTDFITVVAWSGAQITAQTSYQVDQLDDALAHFDQLSASTSPPPRSGSGAGHAGDVSPNVAARVAIARDHALFTEPDEAAWLATIAEDVVADERGAVVPRTIRGRAELRREYAAIIKSTIDFEAETTVLAVAGDDVVLCRLRVFESDAPRTDAGAILDLVNLCRTNADGLIERSITFDVEHLQEAREEFTRWAEPDPDKRVLLNTAARTALRNNVVLFGEPDEEAWLATFADDVTIEDRQRMAMRTLHGKAEVVGDYRSISRRATQLGFEVATEILGVRDENLALTFMRVFEADADGRTDTDVFLDHIALYRTDGEGLIDRCAMFDVADEHDAWSELGSWWAEQQSGADRLLMSEEVRRQRLYRDREIDAWEATLHPGYESVDHRRVGFGTQDRSAMTARQFALSEAVDSAVFRGPIAEHLGHGVRLGTVQSSLSRGGGGEAGLGMAMVFAPDLVNGGTRTHMQFEIDELARARNAARELLEERRRSVALTEAIAVGGVASGRARESIPLFIELLSADFEAKLLDGTVVSRTDVAAGELGPAVVGFGHLERSMVSTDGGVGLFRIGTPDGNAWLSLEIVEGLQLQEIHQFPIGDLAAAAARFDTAAVAQRQDTDLEDTARLVFEFRSAMNDRAIDVMRKLLSDNFEVADHRQLMYGPLDREGYMQVLQDLVGLPTPVLVGEALAWRPSACLWRGAQAIEEPTGWSTHNSGTFIAASDGGGITRLEAFDDADLDAAEARFEELAAATPSPRSSSATPDPDVEVHSFAHLAGLEWSERARAGDTQAILDLQITPDLLVAEQTWGSTLEMGVEGYEQSLETLLSDVRSLDVSYIGHRGPRMIAAHLVMHTSSAEVRWITVAAYEPSGRFSRLQVLTSATEAQATMDRWLEEEQRSLDLRNSATMFYEHAGHPLVQVAAVRADHLAVIETEDGFLAVEVDDFGELAVDHLASYEEAYQTARSAATVADSGTPTDPSLAAFSAAMAAADRDALEEVLSPAFVLEVFGSLDVIPTTRAQLIDFVVTASEFSIEQRRMKLLARAPSCACFLVRTIDAAHGTSLDRVHVFAADVTGLTYIGMWPVEMLDDALAVFDELSAESDAAHDPLDAVDAGIGAALLAGDADAFAAHFAEDLDYRTDRTLADVGGGKAQLIENYVSQKGYVWSSEPIVRVGRAGVFRVNASLPGDNELEWCVLVTVNDEGLIDRWHVRELTDLRLALAAAGEFQQDTPTIRVIEAMNTHDEGRIRECLHPDFVLEDHRPGSPVGSVDGDEWVRLQVDYLASAPDSASWGQVHDMRGGVVLGEFRRWSDPTDPPTWHFLVVATVVDDRIRTMNTYAPADIDTARARFDELTESI